jgi:thiol-disulfide isomerase/thioredoxin
MKIFTPSSILAIAVALSATTIGSNFLHQNSATAIVQNISTSLNSHNSVTLLAQGESTPLAAQLQGKPVVVDIYASWCPACKNIAPTLSQLKQQYGNKANFVVFDVSDSKKTQASMKMAAKLGLTSFFNANKSKTSTVAIIDPANGKVTKQFQNNANATEYTNVLDRSLAQMGSSDALKKPDGMKKTLAK